MELKMKKRVFRCARKNRKKNGCKSIRRKLFSIVF
jgi:hypothetical protein